MNSMKDKIFIDTNLWVYAYTSKDLDKRNKARDILFEYAENIVISTQVVNEFSFVMLRKFKIDIKDLNTIVKRMIKNYEVSLIYYSTIEKAFDLIQKYNFSYYDSLIVSSALENECSVLYSEDMHHGLVVENKLKIINPFKEEND